MWNHQHFLTKIAESKADNSFNSSVNEKKTDLVLQTISLRWEYVTDFALQNLSDQITYLSETIKTFAKAIQHTIIEFGVVETKLGWRNVLLALKKVRQSKNSILGKNNVELHVCRILYELWKL